MYDYYLKSTSRLNLELSLLNAGLLIEFNFGNGDKIFIPNKDVLIAHIGDHVKKHPIADTGGNIIEDAVLDKNWHTNIRLKEPLTEEQKQMLPLIDPPPSSPSYIFG